MNITTKRLCKRYKKRWKSGKKLYKSIGKLYKLLDFHARLLYDADIG